MNKQKLSKLKSKAKYRMPEILSGLSLLVGIAGALYIKKTMSETPFLIHIDPKKADSILVLEQVGLDTFKDLDFGTLFHVTPIPE